MLGAARARALKQAAEEAKPGSGAKLDRAPTLIAVSVEAERRRRRRTTRTCSPPPSPPTSSCWAPTPAGSPATGARVPVMDAPAGRAALGIPDDELPIGLLHLGDPRQEQRVPDRAPVEEIAFFLD